MFYGRHHRSHQRQLLKHLLWEAVTPPWPLRYLGTEAPSLLDTVCRLRCSLMKLRYCEGRSRLI